MKETEAGFQDKVIEYARLKGWRVAHFRPAQTVKGWRTPVAADGNGFPDLVLVRPTNDERAGVIFAELKSEAGKVRPEQREWLHDLERAGVEAYVWRPSNFDDVMEILR